jgi:creatinine amidohydrolase/Fe(II)-dependent formamide hydrolase-like protein
MSDILRSVLPFALSLTFYSFHANDAYFQKFIEQTQRDIPLFIIHTTNQSDEIELESLLCGPCDGHAGNSELSNILAIDPKLVTLPPSEYKKNIDVANNAFDTDNLIDYVSDGIVDANPNWVVDSVIGQKILDLYTNRVILNMKRILDQ